jgi:hypothetical protein
MLSSRVQFYLYRWVFRTARLEMINGPGNDLVTDREHDLVNALASIFGDVGPFSGEMSYIIREAVRSVLSQIDDLEDGTIEREMQGG